MYPRQGHSLHGYVFIIVGGEAGRTEAGGQIGVHVLGGPTRRDPESRQQPQGVGGEPNLFLKLPKYRRLGILTGFHAPRWDFANLIERRAASILQPDAGVCGGITEWRKIAALAAAHDIAVAPHWLADLHVHMVASTPNAVWVEYLPKTQR